MNDELNREEREILEKFDRGELRPVTGVEGETTPPHQGEGGGNRLRSGKLRWKLAEIAIEAVMIVFAVLLALGFEEWRDEQQLRQLADRARVAVDVELQQNLTEFGLAEASLIDGREVIANALQGVIAMQRGTPDASDEPLGFTLGFPEVSRLRGA